MIWSQTENRKVLSQIAWKYQSEFEVQSTFLDAFYPQYLEPFDI